MFRKPLSKPRSNRMKNSAVRSFKAALLNQYPNLREEDLDVLVPKKVDILRFRAGKRQFITVADEVMFFDLGGENWAPSLYALWLVPHFLPAVVMNSSVFSFLERGADLMLPGVVGFSDTMPPDWVEGLVVSVVAHGSGAALAIGTMEVSSGYVSASGMVGKGVVIHHILHDYLWDAGSKAEAPEGLAMELIDGPPASDTGVGVGGDAGQGNGGELDAGGPSEDVPAATSTAPSGGDDGGDGSGSSSWARCSDGDGRPRRHGDSASDGGSAGASADDEDDSVMGLDPDALLRACFLSAIKEVLDDADLPLSASEFFDAFVKPCAPPGHDLRVKDTSYKKLSKFLKAMAKEGFVKTKQQKNGLQVTSINRTHGDLVAFQPPDWTTRPLSRSDSDDGDAVVESARTRSLWRPKRSLMELFPDASVDSGLYFSEQEVTDRLWDFVTSNSTNKTKKTVTITPVVGALLFDDGSSQTVSRRSLRNAWMDRMQEYHHAGTKPNGRPIMRKGPVPHIKIVSEKRQGRKYITRVRGVEVYGIDPEALADALKTRFAASTTVMEADGVKANLNVHDITIQGNIADEAEAFFWSEYGIPGSCLDFSKGKAKNRKRNARGRSQKAPSGAPS